MLKIGDIAIVTNNNMDLYLETVEIISVPWKNNHQQWILGLKKQKGNQLPKVNVYEGNYFPLDGADFFIVGHVIPDEERYTQEMIEVECIRNIRKQVISKENTNHEI